MQRMYDLTYSRSMSTIHVSDPWIRSMHRFTAPIYGSDPLVRSMALVRSTNRMVSWPVSRSVGRLVDGMVDWAVGLVVIGGWRRQIILSYKITNNIIGVLRANSLVAPWPGVCIVYRTSQHDRCGAPLGPFGFVFVFRKKCVSFLFLLFKIFFLGPRGDCGGMRPTGHKHSPGCGTPEHSDWTAVWSERSWPRVSCPRALGGGAPWWSCRG